MARRSEHTPEQIREMVLNAAEKIIIKDGVDALTARKVAMEIGYTVGSIYMVFTNMDDLIMHVKGKTLDELAEQMRSISTKAGAEQQIQSMAEVYLDFAHQHFNRWQMIFDVRAGVSLPDWYQQKIQQLFMMVEKPFQQLLPKRPTKQVQLAVRALWSGVHGVSVLSLNGSLGRVGVQNADVTVNLLVDNFIRGWQSAELPVNATSPKK